MHVPRTPVDQAWSSAIAEYEAFEANGRAENSLRRRLRILSTFGRSVGVAPWGVTAVDIEAWLSSSGYARETLRTYRVTINEFYRWALRSGAIKHDPRVVHDSTPARAVSPRWAEALERWRGAQLEQRIAESTIDNRLKSLRRFEGECGVASPWNVSTADIATWLEALPPTRSMRAQHRTALRSFYRWAVARQHVEVDPTEALVARARTVLASPEWETALLAYRRFLRAEGKPESTVELRLSQMRRFARDHAALGPKAIAAEDVVDWLAHRKWQPATKRGHRGALRHFFHWAKQSGLVKKDPAKRLPKVKSIDYVARPASDDDVRLAIAKADARERLMLRLAAELGLRCGEIAQVHASDIRQEPDGFTLVVHGKGRRDRVLPLTPSLLGALRARGQGWAFPGRIEGHISAEYVSKRGSSLLPPGVTMHMLRHRFATKSYGVDRDILTVQQLLGHASPATTQRYVRVSSDRMRSLVEAVSS